MPARKKQPTKTAARSAATPEKVECAIAVDQPATNTADLTPEVDQRIDQLTELVAADLLHAEIQRRLPATLARLMGDETWLNAQMQRYRPILSAASAAGAMRGARGTE